MEGPDINHFHPNYFSGQRWNLADMRGSELSYRIAKYAYESENRRIFDSTFKGKLDVFEKLPFDSILLLHSYGDDFFNSKIPRVLILASLEKMGEANQWQIEVGQT